MKRFLIAAIGLGVVAVLVLPLLFPDAPPAALKRSTPEQVLAKYDPEELEAEIRTFCTQCHGFPEPSLFPEHRWPSEIDRAFGFHRDSGRTDVKEPDSTAVLAWYVKYSEPQPVATTPLETDKETVFAQPVPGPMLKRAAGVANVLVVDTAAGKQIYTSDMISGRMNSIAGDLTTYNRFYEGTNPGRLRPVDLNPDCEVEYLLSDLGTPGVTDELVGKVQWLQQTSIGPEGPVFDVTTLQDGLSRTADARAADFDGDGDQDVVIAEFGWEKTGSVVLLENDNGTFKRSTIDKRHGAVQLEIVDFDADGKLDFVVIFGQELESVEVFRNVGDLKFEVKQIYRSETPSFGMSSLALFDNDGDGDLDILFTSGDMYDSFQIQKHHGLYMLTNDGDQFPVTFLGTQIAAMCTEYGDVDGDGDIDIVAGSFIPQETPFYTSKGYPALVLYEQTEPMKYRPRVLKAGDCAHAAIELADLDDDGDLDLIVGSMHDQGSAKDPAVMVWKNTTADPKQAALGSSSTPGESRIVNQP